VPASAMIAGKGDWHTVLWLGAGANVVVALMAVFVLKPMRAAARAKA
jgi:hypothetical protein